MHALLSASADKGTHGFSRGKTTTGIVILVDGRQPIFLVCLARPPFILCEKLQRTCGPVWSVVGKAEDAGLLAQAKDDNAADDVPDRPASACALVN